ncbi:reverse transcriptase, partial [Paraburkholderia hospita]
VHCRSETQAQEVMHAIASRLAECGLQLHPEKSKIVYCKDRSRNEAYPNVIFTFLGFLFRPRRVLTKSGWLSTSFLPGVSPAALKRMRQAARRWRLPRQTSGSLVDLAEQCNPTIRGWWNYYGAFYRTAMHGLGQYLDRKLVRWAQRKYKTLRRHKRRSDEWLHKMKKAYPRQFVHWQFQGAQVG